MKKVPVNWPVVLFFMAVVYFASKDNTSFWMSTNSTPLVSCKTLMFLLYWCFSYSWAW